MDNAGYLLSLLKFSSSIGTRSFVVVWAVAVGTIKNSLYLPLFFWSLFVPRIFFIPASFSSNWNNAGNSGTSCE
jgi:hypothetical protein